MDKIILTGIRAHAFHGVYPEERRVGQEFVLDLEIRTDLRTAGETDDLNFAIDYSSVAKTAYEVLTGDSVNLIETLATNIAQSILTNYSGIESVLVTVHKPDAPLGLAISDISVVIERPRS